MHEVRYGGETDEDRSRVRHISQTTFMWGDLLPKHSIAVDPGRHGDFDVRVAQKELRIDVRPDFVVCFQYALQIVVYEARLGFSRQSFGGGRMLDASDAD